MAWMLLWRRVWALRDSPALVCRHRLGAGGFTADGLGCWEVCRCLGAELVGFTVYGSSLFDESAALCGLSAGLWMTQIHCAETVRRPARYCVWSGRGWVWMLPWRMFWDLDGMFCRHSFGCWRHCCRRGWVIRRLAGGWNRCGL